MADHKLNRPAREEFFVVTGETNFYDKDGVLLASLSDTGKLTVDGDLEVTGDVTTGGDSTVTGNLVTGSTIDNGTAVADTVSELTPDAGVTVDGVLLKDSEVTTDVIHEKTAATGVTADGVLLKDAGVTATGGFIGNLTGKGFTVVDAPANGAIAVPTADTVVFLSKAGVNAMTLADPANDAAHNGVRLHIIAATANAHTVDNGAGSGFNGGGAGTDKGTYGGAIFDRLELMAYGGKWYVTGNTNVTLG